MRRFSVKRLQRQFFCDLSQPFQVKRWLKRFSKKCPWDKENLTVSCETVRRNENTSDSRSRAFRFSFFPRG